MNNRYVPLSFLFYCIAMALLVGFMLGKTELKGVKYVAPGNEQRMEPETQVRE